MTYFSHYDRKEGGWIATLFWSIEGHRHQCSFKKTKHLEESKRLLEEEIITKTCTKKTN